MTIEEANKLLDLLNKNKLEQLREYIENQKIEHFDLKRQQTFEKYMDCRNYKKNPVLYDEQKNGQIIFSNRYSLYYVNSNYLNTNSVKIMRNPFGCRVDFKYVKKLEDNIKKYITNLVEAEFFTTPISQITPKPYYTYGSPTTLVESTIPGKLIEAHFNQQEIEFADIMLDSPKYKMDEESPLLLAESEVGKAYILGYRKEN